MFAGELKSIQITNLHSEFIKMSLKISEKANPNYLAKVVKLNGLRKHSNADKLQVITIDGNNVITGLEAKDGDVWVYFPLESAINKEFLSYTNSYEDKTLNANTEIRGFFNSKGRVRAINLRNEKSCGYIVPTHSIEVWLGNDFKITEEDVNTEFDTICGKLICEKYVNREAIQQTKNTSKKNQKKLARESKLIEGQFAFHIDTPQLGKYAHHLNPYDVVHISKKLHGTSAIAGKVLCNRRLNIKDRIARFLGVKVQDTEYQLIWSSRKVVKNGNYYLSWQETLGRNVLFYIKKPQHLINDLKNPATVYRNLKDWWNLINTKPAPNHYYSYDLWRDVALSLENYLTDGLTIYCEVVGYTKDGAFIQKQYDYGCKPNTFDIYIYRIVYTATSGRTFEFSTQQIKEYCNKYDLKMVPELYWGRAKDLFDIPLDVNWNEAFIRRLSNEYLERDCDMCVNKVPDEGIVLRREIFGIDPYKFKSFAFKLRETKQADAGEIDLETIESEDEAL
jgi:hypothetical protein